MLNFLFMIYLFIPFFLQVAGVVKLKPEDIKSGLGKSMLKFLGIWSLSIIIVLPAILKNDIELRYYVTLALFPLLLLVAKLLASKKALKLIVNFIIALTLIFMGILIFADATNLADKYLDKSIAEYELGNYEEAIKQSRISLFFKKNYDQALYYLGLSNYYLNNKDEALNYFLDIKDTSSFEDINYYIGNSYYYIEDYENAIGYLSLYIETHEDKDAYYDRGFAYMEFNSDYDSALVDFKKVIEIDPDFSNAYAKVGWIHYQKDEYDQAISYYDQAIALDNDNVVAWHYYELALVYETLEEWETALENYTVAVNDRGPWRLDQRDTVEAVYNVAGIYERLGLSEDAYSLYQEILESAVEEDNNNYFILRYKGLSAYQLFRYDEAIELFSKAIKLNPDYEGAYCERASVYARRNQENDLELALEDYQYLLSINPDHYDADIKLAYIYRKIGDYTKALEYATKAEDKYFESSHMQKGYIYRDLERYTDAIMEFEHVLRNSPSKSYSKSALYFKGLTYDDIKNYSKAIECYDQLLLEYNDDYIYYWRGRAYLSSENYKQAKEDFLRAIELGSNRNVYFHLGRACYNLREYDESLKYYTMNLENNPTDPATNNNMGLVYTYKDDYDNAIKHYSVAIENSSGDSLIRYLGSRYNAYIDSGQLKEAEEDLDRLYTLDPWSTSTAEKISELRSLQLIEADNMKADVIELKRELELELDIVD